ncbi:phage tail family protein [Listeria monocytogenes]
MKTWVDVIQKEGVTRLTDRWPLVFLNEQESDRDISDNAKSITGIDGVIPGTNVYAPFEKTFQFAIRARDSYDAKIIFREMRELLQVREPFFIRYEREPGHRFAVNRVKIESPEFTKGSFKQGVINLNCNVYKGYAESLGTTMNPITFNQEIWSIGNKLLVYDDLIYTHTSKEFQIYNASSDKIDPRMRHQLDITIRCQGKPTLVNKTTGDIFVYSGVALQMEDSLLISGVYPYRNSSHCGKDTNHGVITLAKGWNEFHILGTSKHSISFDFPFLYR